MLLRRVAAVLVLPLVALAACSEDGADSGDPAASTATASTSLDAVTVSEDMDAKPTVEFDAPLVLEEAADTVVVEGDGAAVEQGQQVQAQIVTVDGNTGDEIESSWESDTPASFPVDPAQVNEALIAGVVGATVGSRVLIGVPAQSEGGSSALVVLDLLSAKVLPTRAEGTPVEPPAGLPTVTLAEDGAPTITLPEGEPPAELVVQPLITGEGPVVEQGQTITVQYTGVTWPGGEVFDSSWENGSPAQFPIGVGQVIPGWDAGLVGQPVGSQVLLVIPPAQGYGEQGQPSAGIEGTDTLVFVVDILDAS